jgi:quercetin dioxygenase-like cupin family protein
VSAAVTLPCADLDAAIEFFAELGFRVASVRPADDPRVVVIAGHGVRLRLDRDASGDPGAVHLELEGASRAELTAPNGTRVIVEPLDPPVALPPLEPALVVSGRAAARWSEGRAQMRYRDLMPGRYGGRFIASHIHIPHAGPVPDYVHFHRVRFQLIVCVGGWVRVVYQDQGAPFVLERGDAVLQPPGIRHQVLECGADLEVVEIGSPADHETRADPDRELPDRLAPGLEYGGQRFVHHRGGGDLGVAAATGGLVRAAIHGGDPAALSHAGELRFGFVMAGAGRLETGGRSIRLERGDAVAVPAGLEHRLAPESADFELLEVVVGE